MKYLKKFNEGWKENLAVGLSLAGSVAMGQTSQNQVKSKQSTEQQTETPSQKIERMSKCDGYGCGSSQDLSTAKKIALFNAKVNLKSHDNSDPCRYVVIQDEYCTQMDGKYEYHIVVK